MIGTPVKSAKSLYMSALTLMHIEKGPRMSLFLQLTARYHRPVTETSKFKKAALGRKNSSLY